MRCRRGLAGPLLAGLALLLLLVSRRLDVVEVRGASMLPALRAGDRLVAWRGDGAVRVGQIVLVTDPRDSTRELVKRVVASDAAGVRVAGDNADASTDSRTFGRIPHGRIRWRVLGRYWPLSAIGRVPRRGLRVGPRDSQSAPIRAH